MNYKVFFDFASGLAKRMRVPKGTLAEIMEHVHEIENTLGLEVEQYLTNPPHWKRGGGRGLQMRVNVTDAVLCDAAEKHNEWVRQLYFQLAEWSKTPPPRGRSEWLTVDDAKGFWHALEQIDVDPFRWTGNYYRARMEAAYKIMRGGKADGAIFGERALTPRQAAAVICLFSEWLDTDDLRLDVPRGHDHLASSCDGGYDWCEKCGCAVDPDDARCCRRRGCPLREEE